MNSMYEIRDVTYDKQTEVVMGLIYLRTKREKKNSMQGARHATNLFVFLLQFKYVPVMGTSICQGPNN